METKDPILSDLGPLHDCSTQSADRQAYFSCLVEDAVRNWFGTIVPLRAERFLHFKFRLEPNKQRLPRGSGKWSRLQLAQHGTLLQKWVDTYCELDAVAGTNVNYSEQHRHLLNEPGLIVEIKCTRSYLNGIALPQRQLWERFDIAASRYPWLVGCVLFVDVAAGFGAVEPAEVDVDVTEDLRLDFPRFCEALWFHRIACVSVPLQSVLRFASDSGREIDPALVTEMREQIQLKAERVRTGRLQDLDPASERHRYMMNRHNVRIPRARRS